VPGSQFSYAAEFTARRAMVAKSMFAPAVANYPHFVRMLQPKQTTQTEGALRKLLNLVAVIGGSRLKWPVSSTSETNPLSGLSYALFCL
jgi:hypothetical protein